MIYTNGSNREVTFTLQVRVPYNVAMDFASAMTGNDTDIILAAETAMRDRIEALGSNPSVEIGFDGDTQEEIMHELFEAGR